MAGIFYMSKSVFNPVNQQTSTSSKIVVGLERIAEAFKVLLWEKAKQLGISPIQIQILTFSAYHKQELCTVSYLAKEFNVTKPTISDAIKVLHQKKMIRKDYSNSDSRSYSIILTAVGQAIISETKNLGEPLQKTIDTVDKTELDAMFSTLSKLIYQLNRNGILTVQRTCFGCSFYDKKESKDYCNLLNKTLVSTDIRLDCPEFMEK